MAACLVFALSFLLLNSMSHSMAQDGITSTASSGDSTQTPTPTVPVLNTISPSITYEPVSPDPISTPDPNAVIGYDPAVEIPEWIPEEEIPFCEFGVLITAEMAAVTSPIDYGTAPRCRIREVPVEMSLDVIPPARWWENFDNEDAEISAPGF